MITVDNILDIEKYAAAYSGVIFDLDDTLYSEKEYVKSGYRQIAKSFPDIENMEQKLWKAFQDGKPAIDEVMRSEGRLDRESKEKALWIYRNQVPEIHLYQGVREMLGRLNLTKKLGMITDGRPEGQRAKIEVLGISPFFDTIIITDELGGVQWRKPNPEAFRMIQKKWDFPFEEIVYIGDNPQKDFIAPETLHMQSLFFRNKDGLYTFRVNKERI